MVVNDDCPRQRASVGQPESTGRCRAGSVERAVFGRAGASVVSAVADGVVRIVHLDGLVINALHKPGDEREPGLVEEVGLLVGGPVDLKCRRGSREVQDARSGCSIPT